MRTRKQRNEIRRLVYRYHRLIDEWNEGTALYTGTWTLTQERENDRRTAVVLERLDDLRYDIERLVDSGS